MIDLLKIGDFFDKEYEANKESHEKLMKEKVSERVRRRKAISGLKFVEMSGSTWQSDGNVLLKYSYEKNVSDFKEGDSLILHNGKSPFVECALFSYGEDKTLTVAVYPSKIGSKDWMENASILDKACVDIRDKVYGPFLEYLRFLCYKYREENEGAEYFEYFNHHLINTRESPHFLGELECQAELDKAMQKLGLEITPKQHEAISKSMSASDYYMIQGPPGTGKSFVLGVIILEELLYFKHRVGVIGPNHMAINNVLGQVLKMNPGLYENMVKIGQYYHTPRAQAVYKGEIVEIANIARLSDLQRGKKELSGLDLWGMTPHCLYTSRTRYVSSLPTLASCSVTAERIYSTEKANYSVRSLSFDTLIIDEAGQMSLPLAMMGMIKARKVIFAGDHKQLPPIIMSDKIPAEMTQSIFQRLMREDNCTMLDLSFRMCKGICDFVSDLFYDGDLRAMNETGSDRVFCDDALYSFDSPVIMCDVSGNEGKQVCEKEAEAIVEIVRRYLSLGVTGREIGILSPFRAQAAHVRRLIATDETISKDDYKAMAIDTIDKMQGQERDIIIFSTVSGDVDYMNEMGEFLFNPNKMNVAFSRAKSKLIIVGDVSKLKTLNKVIYPHIGAMLNHPNLSYRRFQ